MSVEHTQTGPDVLSGLHTSPQGLGPDEAAVRLRQHGPNELQETISRPAWRMLLAQFIEPMILILIAAALLAFFLGNLTEGSAILAIVVLFGVLGFIQEYQAEKAMAALKQLSSPMVRVRRDGILLEIPARELVPGDIVLLETGNIVPADLRLTRCVNLRILESTLTGESDAVRKQTETLPDADVPLGDRTNCGWMGTVVVQGRGEGVVTGTGMQTELGKIAGMIQNMDEGRTPLQQKLAQVGKHLSLAGLIAGAAVFVMGILRGNAFGEMLLTSVSLLVAVIPEGLPAVITATLALGGRRMLKRHALIRKLPAVETLGAVTVICTDKTGTLTENRMTVTRLHSLHRDVMLDSDNTDSESLADQGELIPLLLAGALCNDAHLVPSKTDADPSMIGDPTESALLVAAERFGISTPSLAKTLPRIAEYPFDSDRKRMSTLHRNKTAALPLVMQGPVLVAVKGSPDGLLEQSAGMLDEGRIVPLTGKARQKFLTDNERMANDGIRVLGIAFRLLPEQPAEGTSAAAEAETDLVFCGLVGMMDPPREAVRSSIAGSHAAGIRTLMITGDHPLTAAAIARNLRLTPDGEEPRIMTGTELAVLSDEELEKIAGEISVYARVSPADKLRIVTALQECGQIVAMTGDGVNDSPALKRAEIGVAMGITGTDVARESSKMVLLDDNFATIVSAIEEGRIIYDNLVRFIKYSFGGNLGKVLVMMLAPLAGISSMALRPLHLLWLNLMTDGLMGLALGLEGAETNVMTRPPRKPEAAILDRPAILHVGWMGLFICLSSLLLAGIWETLELGGSEWQTVLFSAIGFAQIGQAWGLRALTSRPFRFAPNPALWGLTLATLGLQLGVIYVPALARIFHLQALSMPGLIATAGLGVLTFVVVHLERRFSSKV